MPFHEIKNYSTFICPFQSKSTEMKRKNKRLNISRKKRAFQMKWKVLFTEFEGFSFGEKIIMKKIADTNFKNIN